MSVIFKALDQEFSYPESWADVTLSQFIHYLEKIEPHKPEKLTQMMSEEDPEKRQEIWASLTDVEYSHKFLPFFALYVSHFTGMPYSMIMGTGEHSGTPGMNRKQLDALWNLIEFKSLGKYDYDPKFLSFEFEGVTYHLPQRYMENGSVIEFMESAQLQAQAQQLGNSNWSVMAKIVGILARPKGEEYSETGMNQRAQIFQNLPMNIVLNTAFFLLKLNMKLSSDSLIYMLSHQLSKLKQESKLSQMTMVGI